MLVTKRITLHQSSQVAKKKKLSLHMLINYKVWDNLLGGGKKHREGYDRDDIYKVRVHEEILEITTFFFFSFFLFHIFWRNPPPPRPLLCRSLFSEGK